MPNLVVAIATVSIAVALLLIAIAYITDRLNLNPAAKATTQQLQVPTPLDWIYYRNYLDVCIQCVGNIYSSCGLCRPGDLPQHMAPGGNGIHYQNGRMGFIVYFDRNCNLTGGVGNFEYTTTPLEKIVAKVNSVLPNYCIANGLAPAIIVDARDVGNGRVAFLLG